MGTAKNKAIFEEVGRAIDGIQIIDENEASFKTHDGRSIGFEDCLKRNPKNRYDIAAALSSELEITNDADWQLDNWLLHAVRAGDPIILIKDTETGAGIGFFSFQLSHWNANESEPMNCDVDLVSLYLAPAYRGLGISSKMRDVVAGYLERVAFAVDHFEDKLTSVGQEPGLLFSVTWNALSYEGKLFCENVVDQLEARIIFHKENGRMHGISIEREIDELDSEPII